MTVTLDLSPEVEARLRDHAAVEGVDPSVVADRVLGQNLLPSTRHAREDDVFRRINTGFPAEFWDRFHVLTDRAEAEELTDAERDEFVAMADAVELANARRLEAVVELAALRGTTFDATLDALGLRPKAKAARE